MLFFLELPFSSLSLPFLGCWGPKLGCLNTFLLAFKFLNSHLLLPWRGPPIRDSGLRPKAGEEKSIPDSTHCCPMLSGNQELEPSLVLRCVLWILCAGGWVEVWNRAPTFGGVWLCYWQTSVPWNCHYWHLGQKTLIQVLNHA